MQFKNFVRRQKWRLRPLKQIVLPLRNVKRGIVALFRPPLTIARSTAGYSGPSLIGRRQIHPAEPVQSLPRPPAESDAITRSSEPAWVFEFKNIDFWGRYGGSVVTADLFLIGDLSPEVWGVDNHPIFSRFRLPKVRPLRGRTGIAVTPEAAGNYYHWLVDLLPRVSLLTGTKGEGLFFDRLFVNGSHAPYEAASLQASGIPEARIRYVDSADRFELEHATIPSMDHLSKIIAPWKIEALRVLRDSLPRTESAGGHRLYVSRRRAAVRRVANESEFEPILREKGFTFVELESKSWAQQVAMFAEAEVVLAPHGAALANIAFCNPGTLIAEINTRAGYRDFYLQLAASARLRYRWVEARPRVASDSSSVRATENEDMIVDIRSLEELLAPL